MIPAKLAAIDGSREASRAWTPSFIAATEPLPAALTIKPEACGFFSFFSCPYKKRTRFSPFQRRRNVLFSLRRKAPKDSPRRCLGLSSCYWEAHTHGSQQTEPRTYVRSPSFAVREVCATEKPAPAGARLPERTRCPFGVFRRGLHELTSANTCWEPTECALGSHKRSSGTLAVSFRPFLVRTRKGHASLLSRGKKKI